MSTNSTITSYFSNNNNNNNLNRKPLDADSILEDFYSALADGDIKAIRNIHIPRSDVFYVRQKYFIDTGEWITLDRMERCMYLEGLLAASEVRDPDRVRDWEYTTTN